MHKPKNDVLAIFASVIIVAILLWITYAMPWHMLPIVLCAILFAFFWYCHIRWLKDGFKNWQYKTYSLAIYALFLSTAILILLTYSSRSILPIDDKIAEYNEKEERELQRLQQL